MICCPSATLAWVNSVTKMHTFKSNPINETSYTDSPCTSKWMAEGLVWRPVWTFVSITVSIEWQNIHSELVYCFERFSAWCLSADSTSWFHKCVFLCVSLLGVMWLRVPWLCASVAFKHFYATMKVRVTVTLRACVCLRVCTAGSCREHHQHAVAADGEWFGGAEAITDGPCTADYQHGGTWRSTVQGTSAARSCVTQTTHIQHILSVL